MNFIEMIGFIISLFALLFLMLKQGLEARRKRMNPEEYEREEIEQSEKLKAFMKAIYEEPEEEQVRPVPKKTTAAPIVKNNPHQGNRGKYHPVATPPPNSIASRKLDVKIEKRQFKSALEEHYAVPIGSGRTPTVESSTHRTTDAYSLKKTIKTTRVLKTLSNLRSRQDIIILHELISRPKGL